MALTIPQLQAMYKAIHGVEAGDVHRLRASFMFNVEYLAITKEQRSAGKAANFLELYATPIKSFTDFDALDKRNKRVSKQLRYKPITNWSFGPTV